MQVTQQHSVQNLLKKTCLHILFETDKAKRVECAKGHFLGERCISHLHVSNLMCWQHAQINKTETFLVYSQFCSEHSVRLP